MDVKPLQEELSELLNIQCSLQLTEEIARNAKENKYVKSEYIVKCLFAFRSTALETGA